MDSVNMTNTSLELFRAISKMSSLLELHLSNCYLDALPPSFPFGNITSLSFLDLSGNAFNSSIPSWMFNMSTLTKLFLSSASLGGPLPFMPGRWYLCKLQHLDLSNNYDLTGDITEMIEALSCNNRSLKFLYLHWNNIIGKLPHSLEQFNNLLDIDLSSNSLSGPIPASVGNLSNLGSLNLESNMMNGTIPQSIGQLTWLSSLNLLQNYWEGTITNIHFHNLTSLSSFSVSSENNSFALKLTHDWVPPFKNLSHFEIRGCQVGPTFPNWLLHLKSLNDLILQNAGISGEIPYWLCNMSSQILQLDLSDNNITGYLPKEMNFSSSNSTTIDFSFNQLKGSIPLWSGLNALFLRNNLLSGIVPANIGKEMSHLKYLDLSNNHLSGNIPLSIYWIENLTYIDLSSNYLTGEIPNIWMGLPMLQIIDLSNNNLSGGIPTSICSAPFLFILDLSNNNLSANLSLVFQNCTRLQTLSLGNNRFFGSMSKEITNIHFFLAELLLRGNIITGSIPEEVCNLPFLHLLDLGENNISGSIPTCIGDMNGFRLQQTYFVNQWYGLITYGLIPYTRHTELVVNGRITEYLNQMPAHSTIDLSKNHISGELPENMTKLFHLGALNLSWNQLTGNIPRNIGSLTNLESVDLSHKHLWGQIPPSMASMTFLSHLNLSYNNLSGQIPVGNQFGTFHDPSIYVGNPMLCGYPLPTNCSSSLPGNQEQEKEHEGDDEKSERLGLYASIAVGFITGFWAVCGSLILKRSWRHAYFNFAYDMRDKLVVFTVLNLARAKRRFGRETN